MSDNQTVAAQLGCSTATVGKWRRRFVEKRLDGLTDEPRPGGPRSVSDELVEQVVVETLGADAAGCDALVAVVDGGRDRAYRSRRSGGSGGRSG